MTITLISLQKTAAHFLHYMGDLQPNAFGDNLWLVFHGENSGAGVLLRLLHLCGGFVAAPSEQKVGKNSCDDDDDFFRTTILESQAKKPLSHSSFVNAR
jgi:hypothetical protein